MSGDGNPSNAIWGPQPVLSDGVLILRPFRPGDAWAMVEWDMNPDTQRFLTGPPPASPDEHIRLVWWAVRRFHRDYELADRIAYVVTEARSEHVVGSVELHHVQGDSAEISYMTIPSRRSEGIAQRAVAILCSEAPERFGITSVELEHHVENVASGVVAAKSGFVQVSRQGESVHYLRDLTRDG